MALISSDNENGRTFNNADSFAMTFDSAWKRNQPLEKDSRTTQEERLNDVLDQIKDHPFLEHSPSEALEIAKFRIRLLGLK